MVGQVRQDSTRHGETGQCQTGTGRVEKDRAGLQSVGQYWTGLGKIWQDLAWWTEPDRGGKGSVRQCRTRQVRAGLVCVRIGHELYQVAGQVGPGIWCLSTPLISGALLSLVLPCACPCSLGSADNPR